MASLRGESYKRYEDETFSGAQPDRRPLQIYASDPADGRRRKYRISIDVPNEPDLMPGPIGDLIEVIDYDGEHQTFYAPVNLNDAGILMGGGLEPNESDPRFHQQMVYAVVMRIVETASNAIGHPLTFDLGRHKKLRIFPHAFYGANAFFAPNLNALLFGYFCADESDPGDNIPGQTVFTCLSHDIIAHETTHAIIHRLRPYFNEPTNEDVMAFHEGFSDIVALLQKFSYEEILKDHITLTRSKLQDAEMMIDLAKQFGHATGRGRALRSAIGDPTATLANTFEPHHRGAILVSAVFDGFLTTYEKRIEDLVRLATGGTGVLQPGSLPIDLVNRIAQEASRISEATLDMCFRAFDYLPPVDVTFGDFLRALVTADYELDPSDSFDMRHNLIEGFRKRAIMPEGVASLAEESLLLESADAPSLPDTLMQKLIPIAFYAVAARDGTARRRRMRGDMLSKYASKISPGDDEFDNNGDNEPSKGVYIEAWEYVRENALSFGLDPNLKVAIRSIRPRIVATRDGEMLLQFVILAVQTDKEHPLSQFGVPMRGGATIVVDAEGNVRYVASKPMPSPTLTPEAQSAAMNRLARFERFKNELAAADSGASWLDDDPAKAISKLADFKNLHGSF